MLDATFHVGANMKVFEAPDFPGLCDYAPDALALPVSTALSLADRKLRGLVDLPSLKLAMVVFSSLDAPDDPPLNSRHRDLLWKAFGLPVFEQLRGTDGRVIARECEVHDGLHFDSTAIMVEIRDGRLMLAGRPCGFSAEIVKDHCECGVETPRLSRITVLRIRASSARSAA